MKTLIATCLTVCGLLSAQAPALSRDHQAERLQLRHPLQVFYPELRSSFDEDPEMAARTRSSLLAECVDRDIILFPSHFAEPHYCRVVSGRRGLSLKWD